LQCAITESCLFWVNHLQTTNYEQIIHDWKFSVVQMTKCGELIADGEGKTEFFEKITPERS
jgi:hypothetical protein